MTKKQHLKMKLFIHLLLVLLAALLLSACGVVGNTSNHMSAAFSKASGTLYSPEFYEKATPDRKSTRLNSSH